MATKTLYVGNIPYSSTDADIIEHFSAYGASNARIIEGRGFAFVDIDADQLDQAILDKNNSELGGRRLTVNEAKPRAQGGGRSFSGGNSGGGGDRGYGGGDRGRDWGDGGRDRDRDWGGGGRDRERGGRDRGGRGRY